MRQLKLGGLTRLAAHVLTDLRYCEAKFRSGMGYELLQEMAQVHSAMAVGSVGFERLGALRRLIAP